MHRRFAGAGAGRARRRTGQGRSLSAPAIAHLRAADPVLARLLDEVDDDAAVLDPTRGGRFPPMEHYAALVRAVVGQQVSVAAAASMWRRLVHHFGGRPPLPAEVLAIGPDELKAIGALSRAKVRCVRSLAEHVLDGSLDLERIDEQPDDEVVARLTSVTGIGEWSAQIFLLLGLQRDDVLATGDLGIRRAVQIAWALDELPTRAELVALAEPWRPWRSAASRLLWLSLGEKEVPVT